MKLTRRSLIKSAPLAAAPLAAAAGAMRGGIRRTEGAPVVVYEEGSAFSSEFAAAFPSDLKRFVIKDGGAMQFEDLAALVADVTTPLVGLTGTSSFLLLQRLAADEGRRFAITGSHEPCCDGGNLHKTQAGLAKTTHRDLPDHDAWLDKLAQSYLALTAGSESPSALQQAKRENKASGKLPRPYHSWLLA